MELLIMEFYGFVCNQSEVLGRNHLPAEEYCQSTDSEEASKHILIRERCILK